VPAPAPEPVAVVATPPGSVPCPEQQQTFDQQNELPPCTQDEVQPEDDGWSAPPGPAFGDAPHPRGLPTASQAPDYWSSVLDTSCQPSQAPGGREMGLPDQPDPLKVASLQQLVHRVFPARVSPESFCRNVVACQLVELQEDAGRSTRVELEMGLAGGLCGIRYGG